MCPEHQSKALTVAQAAQKQYWESRLEIERGGQK